MAARQRSLSGGDWTREKLDMLRRYLQAYVTAMRRQPFELMYIDAFAGTGSWEPATSRSVRGLLFPELAGEEPRAFIKGSARIALEVQPPFEHYVFIERSRANTDELRQLVGEFPSLEPRVRIVPGDCNEELPRICSETDWLKTRAVLFLDPFAMQLEWHVLQSVAATRAIDTWVLWPVMAMNRLLEHKREIPPAWGRRLDRFLGTADWYNEFYRVQKGTDLFGQDTAAITKVRDFDAIKSYLNRRLSSIFPAVADNPRLLRNSQGTCLFLLCFAIANPSRKAVAVAKRIAEHILGSGESGTRQHD